MNAPRPGWSLEQAVDLLAQGYSPEHVESVTGYDARHLRAATRRTTPRSTLGDSRYSGS